MTTNKYAVIALLAVGVLGVSACDRSGNDSAANNAATTTTTTTDTQVVDANSTTTSNSSTSSGTGTTTDTKASTADNTMATGTAVDETSGGAGLSAEQPGSADARETTAGAKKKHSTKKMKKKDGKAGAYIPPRGDTNPRVVTAEPESTVLEEEYDSSSATTTSSSQVDSSDETADNSVRDPISNEGSESAMANDSANATSLMSKQQALNLAFEKQDRISKFYEPQSRMPDRTGSTSLTGQDRSHAQMTARPGPFADPTVMAANDTILQSQPLQTVQIERYSYGRRSQFKNLMETRLGLVHEKIGQLRSVNDDNQPSNFKTVLRDTEKKRDYVQDQLGDMSDVDRSGWDSYRAGLRDQVLELERSVDSLQTSMRR